MRSWTNLRDRSRPHISAALPVHAIISSPGFLNGGREGESSWLSVTPVPRTSSGPLRRMRQLKRVRAVSLMQQLHRPTTERVLLADLHVELRSLLSLLRNWQTDQFTCIIRTPDFERGIMVKIVHIIIKFLRYYLCHLCTSDNVTTNEHQQSVQLMAYDMAETRTEILPWALHRENKLLLY